MIFSNEKKSVDRIETLNAGRSVVVSIENSPIHDKNNNKLIHTFGKANTHNILNDNFFGVVENAIKLHRVVEMYQWKETTRRTKRGRYYKHHKEWSNKLIDSSNFRRPEGHENPASMPYVSKELVATKVTLGAFDLSKSFINEMDTYYDYPLSQNNFNAMDNKLRQSFKLHNGQYFSGNNPDDPQIGAIRIYYRIINPQEVTVVGKQTNSLIDSYFLTNGNITLLEYGVMESDAIFTSAEKDNMLETWGMRFVVFLMMWLGLYMMFGCIMHMIPFIGEVIAIFMVVVTGVISFVVSAITIALAWIVYRPLIALFLFIIAGCGLWLLFKIFQEKTRKNQPAHQQVESYGVSPNRNLFHKQNPWNMKEAMYQKTKSRF